MTGIAIEGAVAVLTGASSGICRATAVALAERGASVVVAARSRADLDEVVEACRAAGSEALAVPTDVAEPEGVDALARAAIDRFGGFDVWINGAAVMAYGSFWDVPPESYRRVIETNLFGAIHGSRTALEHFRERERGLLINVESLYGRLTTPYVSPYVVSKFALRGLTQCLRQETADLADIDVSGVLPDAVDTPIFRHAANYTGSEVTALPAAIDPGRVVAAILRCVERPKPQVIVGTTGNLAVWTQTLMPRVYERLAPHVMDRLALRPGPAERSHGNLFDPQPELNVVDGGWRAERRTLRWAAAAGLTAAALAPVGVWWRRRTG